MFRADVLEGGVVRMVMSRELFGRDLYPAACYLAGGVLVDTGIAHLRKDLVSFLKGRPVEAIVNTHAHEAQGGS